MTHLHHISPDIDQRMEHWPTPTVGPRHLAISLAVLALAIILAVGIWLVWPAIGTISEAASSRSMCPGLPPSECIALAQTGGL